MNGGDTNIQSIAVTFRNGVFAHGCGCGPQGESSWVRSWPRITCRVSFSEEGLGQEPHDEGAEIPVMCVPGSRGP